MTAKLLRDARKTIEAAGLTVEAVEIGNALARFICRHGPSGHAATLSVQVGTSNFRAARALRADARSVVRGTFRDLAHARGHA